MKTLLILRHAKSSWDEAHLADIQRPLNKRGRRDAPRIGVLLKDEDILPELILTSPAVRAVRTAEAVAETSGYEGEIKEVESFYLGDTEDYLEALQVLPDIYNRVMVVGHNPGLENLLAALTGEEEPLPTAALAQVELPIRRWQDLQDSVQGKVIQIWWVKTLKER